MSPLDPQQDPERDLELDPELHDPRLEDEALDDPRLEDEELDDPLFEEGLRSRRRRLALTFAAILALGGLAVAAPWSESIEASGRTAPEHWARVRSEAPGVVREVRRRMGDAVGEGDVIAVLDSDELRDALESARLGLGRERQKLADLELRLRENAILREGTQAAREAAERRAAAGERIDGSRLAALDPAAESVLDGVRGFASAARGEMAMDRAARARTPFHGDALHRSAQSAMAQYEERADGVARQLGEIAGSDAATQFRFELESVRFAYSLAERSMEEILLKRELVSQDYLAPSALRELSHQLEREAMDLAQTFRALAASGRSLAGTPAERHERVRAADESARLLANEGERLEAERASVAGGIAQAELAVRGAERNTGRTAIRAPIRGVLTGAGVAEFDGVGANTPVGVVESADGRVLKLRVAEPDWYRVVAGQEVWAHARGRSLRGAVAWKVPLAGQEVRDQDWNVLVRLDRDDDDVEAGEKVTAAIEVGRRSWLSRLLARRGQETDEPRVAFVDDPTEQRSAVSVRELADATPAADGESERSPELARSADGS